MLAAGAPAMVTCLK